MHGTIGPLAAPFDAAASDTLNGFERMQCGGILLDEAGRVLHLNARARRHLGDALTITDEHITAQDDSADRALQDLIATALQPRNKRVKRAGRALMLPRSGAPTLAVRVLKTSDDACSAFGSARAVVLILDPHERAPSAGAVLQAVFCLTPAEARVALGVMCGDTLAQIARAHQVALNTVRLQLKTVFAKTQTGRQAELVTLLTRVAFG